MRIEDARILQTVRVTSDDFPPLAGREAVIIGLNLNGLSAPTLSIEDYASMASAEAMLFCSGKLYARVPLKNLVPVDRTASS